eukprot:3792748-Rhodomonas_salina.2
MSGPSCGYCITMRVGSLSGSIIAPRQYQRAYGAILSLVQSLYQFDMVLRLQVLSGADLAGSRRARPYRSLVPA